MVGIAKAALVYLLAVLFVTGCGAGAATREGGTAAGGPNATTDTKTDGGESGAPAPGTEAANDKTSGTTQMITFKTEPPGATIVIDGKDRYTSPVEICLTNGVVHSYEIEKEDYEKVSGTIKSVPVVKEKSKGPQMARALVGGLLQGGVVGALLTTAIMAREHPGYTTGPPRLQTDKIEVALEPESP
jgi:PEGA domain